MAEAGAFERPAPLIEIFFAFAASAAAAPKS
jgi:hypothetical protein